MNKRIGRKLATLCQTFLLLFLMVTGSIYGFLQTDSGRVFVVSQLEAASKNDGGLSIDIGEIRGNLFEDFQIDSIALKDENGLWLAVQDIQISWSPLRLLQGKVQVNSLSVALLDFHRQPLLTPSSDTKTSGPLLPLPVSLSLASLSISRVSLAEAVFGRSAQLRVSMNLNSRRDTSLHSQLTIVPLDGQGGGVDAEIDYFPDTTRLGIVANMNGPEGGLTSRILGLPGYPRVAASIIGDGPLNNWQGLVTANAEGVFSSDFLILTRGNAIIDIDLSGGSTFSEQIASSIPLLDSGRLPLEVTLTYDTKKNRVHLKSAAFENRSVKATMTGLVDLETRALNAAVNVNVTHVASLNRLIEPASVGKATANIQISGNMNEIHAKTTVTVDGVGITTAAVSDRIGIEKLVAQSQTIVSFTDLATVPFDGTMSLTGITNIPDKAKNIVGTELKLRIDGLYSLSSESVNVKSINVKTKHVLLQGAGQFFPREGPSAAALSIIFDDLHGLAAPVRGHLVAKAVFESTNLQHGGRGRIDLKFSQLDIGNKEVQPLLGSDVNMGATVSFANDALVIKEFNAPFAAGHIKGSAEILESFKVINVSFDAVIPQLKLVSGLAGTALAGELNVSGKVSGTLEDPDLVGALTLRSLQVGPQKIGAVETEFSAKNLVSSMSGTMKGEFSAPHIGAVFSTTYDLSEGALLRLSDIVIQQKENKLTGSMEIPLQATPITGSLTVDLPNLKSLAGIGDVPLEGTAAGKIILGNSQGQQILGLSLQSQRISMGKDTPRIGTLDVKLDSQGAFSNSTFKVTTHLEDISQGEILVSDLVLNAAGTPARAVYDFTLEAEQKLHLQLSGKGSVAMADGQTELQLKGLNGHLHDKKIELTKPMQIRQADDSLSITPFSLSLGTGDVIGSATFSQKQAAFDVLLKSIPLDLLNILKPDTPVSGTLNAQANISITPNSSNGRFSARIDDMVLTGLDFPAVSSQFDGKIENGKLAVNASVSGLSETTISAAGLIPIAITLSPFNVGSPDDQFIELTVDAASNIDKMWPLLGLDKHLLNGQMTAKGRVSGTRQRPKVDGYVHLTDGRYEEIELGTILEKLQFSLVAKDFDTIVIAAKAEDGDEGILNASGTIKLEDLNNPSVDLKVQLQEMLVLRQDALTVKTNANLSMSGKQKALVVKGNITTSNIEVDIGGAIAPSVIDLPVTEINFPDGRGSDLEIVKSTNGQKISLDIGIDLPRRVFIRGRGLDSEWEGKFSVKGTASAPVLKGYLSPFRGQFTFSGKAFELEKGAIRLLGKADIDPELSLSAKYEGKNVTAIVFIEGTASNPKIRFSSPDNLPEDEVLSRVLFGKSAAKLSPLEALQLTQAVAEVSGSLGPGSGIMGFARQTLGVDVLSAGVNDDTGEAEVSAGKYINDNIYVGVAQGAAAGSTKARVEIEITPNLSVESETDQTSNSSIGVFWKWDY